MIAVCVYLEKLARDYVRKIREEHPNMQVYYHEDLFGNNLQLEDRDGVRVFGIVFVNPNKSEDAEVFDRLTDFLHVNSQKYALYLLNE